MVTDIEISKAQGFLTPPTRRKSAADRIRGTYLLRQLLRFEKKYWHF